MRHTLLNETLSSLDATHQEMAINTLEAGQILYLPNYAFSLTETEAPLLQTTELKGRRKNVSFDIQKSVVTTPLDRCMQRYARFAEQLVHTLLPEYQKHLVFGRTSYRPAQVEGRVTSKRKDDTRLHVDAFPATPVHGQRILRVFCNINPKNEPRVWEVGEPFSEVMQTFLPVLPRYSKLRATWLNFCKITKTKRSAYDHYMLHLHDSMKLDDHYQRIVKKERFDFAAQSTWLVFTDQASHAALSGQFLLEQTFYLPVEGMRTPALSPIKQWEAAGVF